MRKLTLLLLAALCAVVPATAQNSNSLQHPGMICCDHSICPGDSITQILEVQATTPSETEIPVEYAWFQIVDDSTTASGTKWAIIPNSNVKNYQPTQIASQFGGFFMRAARKTGTLPYLYSNIINVKELGATNPLCVSATNAAETKRMVEIFPNPANASLNIRFNTEAIPNVQLLTITGQIFQPAAVISGNILHLDVQELPTGVYFIQLIDSDGKTSLYKWVKL